MQAETVQFLAVLSIFGAFAIAELAQGKFFAPEATREDNRLDLVVTLIFPLISLSVLGAANLLCQWLMPAQRGALGHWP